VFSVNEMADDVEGVPGVSPFGRMRPGFRKIAEKRVEDRRGALEKNDGLRQAMLHKGLDSWTAVVERR